jgi:TM2 domain-containing membrane protein YozV
MEVDPERYSYRRRRNGLIAMGLGATGLAALSWWLEPHDDVFAFLVRTFQENPGLMVALVFGYLVFTNAAVSGFFLVLAGLKELPLKTSARARAGFRSKLMGANILAALFWYVGLGEESPSLGGTVWYQAAVLALPPGAWLGVSLLRRGFGYDVATAAEVLSDDPRPPVVYTRSFRHDDDRLLPWWSRIFNYWISVSFEQILAENFNLVGPFVAIGQPAEDVPELGAARLYCSDAEWRGRITDLMGRARLIVIRLGGTGNLWWEIEQAIQTAGPRKLIVSVVEKRNETKVLLAGLERLVGREIREPESPSPAWWRAALRMQFGNTPPLFLTFGPEGRPRFERCRLRFGASFFLHPAWPSVEDALRRVLRELGIEVRARKSRVTVFVLALLGGMFGAHHFYTGERRRGWKYLIFCWTMVPLVLGLRDAVWVALASREAFEGRHPGFTG